MEDLKAIIGELSTRLNALQERNAVLERTVARLSSGQGPATNARPVEAAVADVSRRRVLGRAVGIAAAGTAALTLADARPAAAATGDNFVVGQSNSASGYTGLWCTSSTSTGLWVLAGSVSGMSYTAAVLGDSDVQNGVAGLTSADAVGVYGVSHARSGLGYFPAAVFGDSDTHPGVYGESLSAHGVRGVSGAATGTSALQAGVWGDSKDYPGAVGTSTNSFGVYAASTSGAGVCAVGGNTGVLANAPTAVSATSSASSGHAFVGTAASSQPGALMTNNGSGVGLQVTAKTGRGATFKGGAAQIRLLPGPRSSHPTGGSRGDLYADTSGRLWYCKVGGSTATWHQIA